MDIRKSFLDFFQSKGHTLVPSAPLVPLEDDGTLMFVNAGMVPFKSIFTGDAPIPNPPRNTSSQTCLRAGGKHNDLDNVGYTARHHTLFEMLGNFSFGDYFKKEVMAYSWEFITSEKYLNLPIEKLWVTVHEDDDEAYELWQKHISKDRIVKFDDKENFWAMGETGACGPCSEIFYDQGAEHFSGPEDYMGGEGDRFLEIWNLVFMQYDRDSSGKLNPLPKPSIDTGMGLERVIAIKEGKLNNYHSSLFMPFLDKIGELVGTVYDYDASNSASYRVIADHLRSTSFLLAQGVNFDKEGRGYVLRRIMRRAIRHGYLLGLRKPFMHKLVDTLVSTMGEQYPYLSERAESIKASMKLEEERFFETIEAGINLFNLELHKMQLRAKVYGDNELTLIDDEHIGWSEYDQPFILEYLITDKRTKHQPEGYDRLRIKLDEVEEQIITESFNGELAFKLYDTYGFPLDLTEDMLREKNIALDVDAFDTAMAKQKAQSKAAWKGTGDAAATGDFKVLKEAHGLNTFIGYEQREASTKVLALLDEDFKQVDSIDGTGWVMLEQTPFYAESGGQVGDTGILRQAQEPSVRQAQGTVAEQSRSSVTELVEVLDTQKFLDMNLSKFEGKLSIGDEVEAKVDANKIEIEKHHSATHLLHAALFEILGDHVAQAGSLNDDKRLRFDFSHPKAMTSEEIAKVEAWVNAKIAAGQAAETQELSIDDARKLGAKAQFGEKYGDKVRVVNIGASSIELCGGNHVDNTAQIGLFMITKESGVSAGVRRIEAVCGNAAVEAVKGLRAELSEIKTELKNVNPLAGIAKLKEQVKTLKADVQAAQSATKTELKATKLKGATVIVEEVETGDIKELIDEAKNKYPNIAIMLFQKKGDKVMIACGSKETNIKAGNWIKEIAPILGGGGGGRPDFAQAGGKDASKIGEATQKALTYLEENL